MLHSLAGPDSPVDTPHTQRLQVHAKSYHASTSPKPKHPLHCTASGSLSRERLGSETSQAATAFNKLEGPVLAPTPAQRYTVLVPIGIARERLAGRHRGEDLFGSLIYHHNASVLACPGLHILYERYIKAYHHQPMH